MSTTPILQQNMLISEQSSGYEALDYTPQTSEGTPSRESAEIGNLAVGGFVEVLQQPSQEMQEAENEQMRSDLHTLLASFPLGERRDNLMPYFLGSSERFSINEMVSTPEGDADLLRSGIILHRSLGLAKDIIGSDKAIATIMNYPGVKTDQDLNKVRPVHEEWLEVNNNASSHGPQMGTIIGFKVGQQVFEDISSGKADWSDVVYGYLDKGQITEQKALVAKLHAAFRNEPAMPVGHTHSRTSFVIPDARFGGLWRMGAAGYVAVGRSLANWVEQSEHVTLPQAADTDDGWEVTTIDPANIDRISAVFDNEKYKPYVNTFIDLYKAANAAIDSDEGRALLRDHRRQLNTKQSTGSQTSIAGNQEAINEFIAKEVRKRIEELRLSSSLPPTPIDLGDLFLGNIIGT